MSAISTEQLIALVLVMAWVLPWKGVSLWNAAKLGHKTWFVTLLVLNTLAILDIFYIFVIAKRAKKALAQNSSMR